MGFECERAGRWASKKFVVLHMLADLRCGQWEAYRAGDEYGTLVTYGLTLKEVLAELNGAETTCSLPVVS